MVDLQAVASVIQSIQVSEVLVRVRCEHADERVRAGLVVDATARDAQGRFGRG